MNPPISYFPPAQRAYAYQPRVVQRQTRTIYYQQTQGTITGQRQPLPYQPRPSSFVLPAPNVYQGSAPFVVKKENPKCGFCDRPNSYIQCLNEKCGYLSSKADLRVRRDCPNPGHIKYKLTQDLVKCPNCKQEGKLVEIRGNRIYQIYYEENNEFLSKSVPEKQVSEQVVFGAKDIEPEEALNSAEVELVEVEITSGLELAQGNTVRSQDEASIDLNDLCIKGGLNCKQEQVDRVIQEPCRGGQQGDATAIGENLDRLMQLLQEFDQVGQEQPHDDQDEIDAPPIPPNPSAPVNNIIGCDCCRHNRYALCTRCGRTEMMPCRQVLAAAQINENEWINEECRNDGCNAYGDEIITIIRTVTI